MPEQKNIPCETPGWWWNLTSSPHMVLPQELRNAKDGTYKLISITLTLTRVKNSNYPIIYDDGTFISARGNTTSPNPISISITFDGSTSSTNVVSSGPTEMQGTRVVNGTTAYTETSSWTAAGPALTYTFADQPIINSNSTVTINSGAGFVGGNKSGISTGYGWSGCYWTVEATGELPPDPNPPFVPGGDFETTITDLSGASEGGDVLKDYTETFYFSRPSGSHGGSVSFDGGSGSSSLYNIDVRDGSITITAKNANTDYPKGETVNVRAGYTETYWVPGDKDSPGYKATADCSVTFTVSVDFYEKIKREEGNQSIELLARDVENTNIYITSINYGTNAAKAHNAWKNPKSQDLGEFIINSNSMIPLSQYFSLDSDSSNIPKISEDYESVPYLFRFYNSDVQLKTSDRGTYKKDLNIDLYIRYAPNDENQFNYIFLDRNNDQVAWGNLPRCILLTQEDIMVGNLNYANRNVEGGYCRAFRITFRDANTKQKYVQYDLMSEDSFSGSYSGKIMRLGDSNYNALPSNVFLELVIEPYFYFNDSPHTMYSDVAIVIDTWFLKISDADLIPKLFFPLLSKTEPWTHMMLQESERFGYEFFDIIADFWNYYKSKFGINIGGYDLFLDETYYYSSGHVVRHIICDMGSFVANHQMFDSALEIKPFIITMIDTPQEKRIYSPPNNSVLCTTQETMWKVPIATKGDYLKYFDAERFMQFINKYKPLIDYQDWIVPTEMRGYIIDTDFWLQKENQINTNYVDNMYDWMMSPGSGATNEKPCWIHTKFPHIKGQYFVVDATYATHDYLHEMGYTHNYLHQFTHDQIKQQATINNLKQNYYELLTCVSYYVEKRKV